MKNPAAELEPKVRRGIFVREEKVLRTSLILHRGGLNPAIIGVEIEPPQGAGYSTPHRIKNGTVKLIEKYIEKNDLVNEKRKHQEIYLSDPRETETSRMKTILRIPVRKNN
jgi:hypothetical protein